MNFIFKVYEPKLLIRTLVKPRLPMYCRAASASARGAMLDFSVAFFHEIEYVNHKNISFFNCKRSMKCVKVMMMKF